MIKFYMSTLLTTNSIIILREEVWSSNKSAVLEAVGLIL